MTDHVDLDALDRALDDVLTGADARPLVDDLAKMIAELRQVRLTIAAHNAARAALPSVDIEWTDKLACDLLDAWATDNGTAAFRSAVAYVIGRITAQADELRQAWREVEEMRVMLVRCFQSVNTMCECDGCVAVGEITGAALAQKDGGT